jgi:FAD/FMN-containing dehydrogenase
LPLAVVQPGTVAQLQQIARIAAEASVALVPRGGGASYTDAYLPDTPNSLLVDTLRLNRIVEINTEDMYITVEPGVTWAQMTEALAKHGLRTPFWGPFSGLAATVGGSMSQNAVSLGSANYGTSADSVLSFEVVLADGEILRTGSLPIQNGTPFFRWYGPDLTGLFTGDAGALGIKARITLRLMRCPAHFGAASFGFNDFEPMAAGMSEAARAGMAADNYGLDPKLQQGQLGGASAADALNAVWAVLKTSTNPVDGLIRVLKMALAGKRFIEGYDYSAHYVVEGASRAEVRAKLAEVRKAMAGHGTEIANTIPTVLRAAPFIPLYPILGPKGERWACMHGILPFSKVVELHRKIQALFAENAAEMQRHKVHMGGMYTTISTHAFLYEPVFYSQDSRTSFHKRYLPAEYLATLPEYEANPEGRELIKKLREGIVDCYASVGAIHFQVGKCYPYTVGRDQRAMRVLNDVKQSLDPQGLMNPGALGL